MRAAVDERYGPPEVVGLRDVPKPSPRENQLLLRVLAATVNRTDCGFRKGEPRIVRLFSGLSRPKATILGNELAGEVEAVGANVTRFEVGERVAGLTGDTFGAHAEYVCVGGTRRSPGCRARSRRNAPSRCGTVRGSPSPACARRI